MDESCHFRDQADNKSNRLDRMAELSTIVTVRKKLVLPDTESLPEAKYHV